MKLEEKIIMLRKKKNWSQEELAYQLGISRQAVSKWESGLSIPDLDKIILMSQIFAVTTDTLLKDDVLLDMNANDDRNNYGRTLTKDETYAFMDTSKKAGHRIGFATLICVLSPIVLLTLLAYVEHKQSLSESIASSIGIGVIILLVLIAIPIFIISGLKMKAYEFMDKEQFMLRDDIKLEVQDMKKAYQNKYISLLTGGISLCILGAAPLVVISLLEYPSYMVMYMVSILLVAVSVGVYMMIVSGTRYESYQKLLQEEDYSADSKRASKAIEPISTAFWCVVTAGYVLTSLLTNRWDITWIIWPVAGILFGALYAILEAVTKNKRK